MRRHDVGPAVFPKRKRPAEAGRFQFMSGY
jgi:hypothetical protein